MKYIALMYHNLSSNSESVSPGDRPYVLKTEVFERQTNYLYQKGVWVTSLEEMLANLYCGTNPSKGMAVVPTFDDGHISNYTKAFPILLHFGFKGTFFLTVGSIGSEGCISWDQAREMQEAGMEIGSHTLTHPRPIELSDDQLRFELVESKRILDLNLPKPVSSLSSPTGFYNSRMREIAKETGYQCLCIGKVGVNDGDSDPYSLNRVAIKDRTSLEAFYEIVNLEPSRLRKLRWNQYARDSLKVILGVRYYLAVRNFLIERLL